jgi:hypothetical protein
MRTTSLGPGRTHLGELPGALITGVYLAQFYNPTPEAATLLRDTMSDVWLAASPEARTIGPLRRCWCW